MLDVNVMLMYASVKPFTKVPYNIGPSESKKMLMKIGTAQFIKVYAFEII